MYGEGLYDFIELLPVPGSYAATIGKWRSLSVPFVIHAPHFSFGVNFGLRASFDTNMAAVRETLKFADELKARHVVCHPGTESDINEAARQLRAINDPRLLVENKPYKTVDGRYRCIGGSVEEISMVMREAGIGFCLDMGHAASYAVSTGKEPYAYLRAFAALAPSMFHVSDGFMHSAVDSHDHIGAGDFDWARIFSLIPSGSLVTIETKKDSPGSLADFRADVLKYRELLVRHSSVGPSLVVRRAEEKDIKDIFELSNEPGVRHFSISSKSIPWEDHVKWFPEKLKNPDCDYFVAESGGGFAAQVRYQLENDAVVVSISILSSFRGRGFAPVILKESARQVFAARPGLDAITAYICPDNTASVKSFEKAGYRAAGASVMKGREFNRYLLARKTICG